MRGQDSKSLRFFSLSQSRPKIQLRSSGHPRVKSLEHVLSLHNSGHFDRQGESKIQTVRGWRCSLLTAQRLLSRQRATEKWIRTLYDPLTQNKITQPKHKPQFPFIFGNELSQWNTYGDCNVRKNSGQPGNLAQRITAVPLIFIPLLHIWGF